MKLPSLILALLSTVAFANPLDAPGKTYKIQGRVIQSFADGIIVEGVNGAAGKASSVHYVIGRALVRGVNSPEGRGYTATGLTPDGQYDYVTVLGAQARVPAYRAR